MFVCLFICLSFHQTREFFTHLETLPLPMKCCKFWWMLVTHGNWSVGFFSVPHLLFHVASVYNGHLRGQWWHALLFLRLRSVAAATPYVTRGICLYNGHLRGPVTRIPVFTTKICRGWDSNTQPSACKAYALTNSATTAATKKETSENN